MDPSLLHQALKSAHDSDTGVFVYTTSVGAPVTAFLSDDYNYEISLRKLSLKDQVKIRNISDPRLRAKQLASRLFTKLVLNYVLFHFNQKENFAPWNEIDFEYGQYGKPYLALQRAHNFLFSASTSNEILSVVVQFGAVLPVGIDLSHASQTAISPTEFMDQFNEMFHPVERSQLMAVEPLERRYLAFNQLWTLKEAFTKLLGSGLNVDLAAFHFTFSDSLVGRNAILPQNETVREIHVDWQEDIYVNMDKLVLEKSPFVDLLVSKDFFCYLGVLVDDGHLPVIVSVISQKKIRPRVLNFDLLRILS